jgi:hypothetical protein
LVQEIITHVIQFKNSERKNEKIFSLSPILHENGKTLVVLTKMTITSKFGEKISKMN